MDRASLDRRCCSYIESLLLASKNVRTRGTGHADVEPEWPAVLGYNVSTDEPIWIECGSSLLLRDWVELHQRARLNRAAMLILASDKATRFPLDIPTVEREGENG